MKLSELKTMHEHWQNSPYTSNGQRKDSRTILQLIERVENLSETLSLYVLGDENGALDDAGDRGREMLSKYGADVELK